METGSQKEPPPTLSPTTRFEGRRVAKRIGEKLKFGSVIGPVGEGASVSLEEPLLWHVKYDDGDDDYMPEKDVTEYMQTWTLRDRLQNGQHKATAQQHQKRQEREEKTPDSGETLPSNKRRKKRGVAKSPPDNSLVIDLTEDNDGSDRVDDSSRGGTTGEKKNHASTGERPEYVASSQGNKGSLLLASGGVTTRQEVEARSNACKLQQSNHQALLELAETACNHPIDDFQTSNLDNEDVLSNPTVLSPLDSSMAANRTVHSISKHETKQPTAMDVLLLHKGNTICKGPRHPGNQVFHEMAEKIYDENNPTNSAEKWQLAWDILVEWKRQYSDSRFLRNKKGQLEYSKRLSPAEERSAVLCYISHLEKTADERSAKKEAKIVTPRNEDVISVSNLHGVEHPGNIRLRDLCVSHIEEYQVARMGYKQDVSQKIVNMLSDEGVRFLKENSNGMWYKLSNKQACLLVSDWIHRQSTMRNQTYTETAPPRLQDQIQNKEDLTERACAAGTDSPAFPEEVSSTPPSATNDTRRSRPLIQKKVNEDDAVKTRGCAGRANLPAAPNTDTTPPCIAGETKQSTHQANENNSAQEKTHVAAVEPPGTLNVAVTPPHAVNDTNCSNQQAYKENSVKKKASVTDARPPSAHNIAVTLPGVADDFNRPTQQANEGNPAKKKARAAGSGLTVAPNVVHTPPAHTANGTKQPIQKVNEDNSSGEKKRCAAFANLKANTDAVDTPPQSAAPADSSGLEQPSNSKVLPSQIGWGVTPRQTTQEYLLTTTPCDQQELQQQLFLLQRLQQEQQHLRAASTLFSPQSAWGSTLPRQMGWVNASNTRPKSTQGDLSTTIPCSSPQQQYYAFPPHISPPKWD